MQRFVEKKRKQKQKQDAGATAANQTYEASSSRKQIGRSRITTQTRMPTPISKDATAASKAVLERSRGRKSRCLLDKSTAR